MHISRTKTKYEEFGGRPPVGGRPGARAPFPPLNPALCSTAEVNSCSVWNVSRDSEDVG